MKCVWVYSFLVDTILYSCTQPNQTLSLHGTDWQFSELGEDTYHAATVPGSVHTDLLKLGTIPDPFLLNNEDSIQWVSSKDWVYIKTFLVPKKQRIKKQHVLKFEGIDTYAEIFLNDSLIRITNNAFRNYEQDVSSILKAENELKIIVRSVDDIETQKRAALPYELPEAPRVFTRKPQFQYGWDWGPKIKTMGIWRDVSLVSYDHARLKDAFIKTDSVTETFAYLSTQIELEAPKTIRIR